MSDGLETITFPVKDLDAAKQLFFAPLLGTQPYADQPLLRGLPPGGWPGRIGLDPNGTPSGLTGPVAYWRVADIEATIEKLTAGRCQRDAGPA